MADNYPRVFVPDRAFSSVSTSLSRVSQVESNDGESPSLPDNLGNFDPLIRFYTSGRDANALTWTVAHQSIVDRDVNAIGSLFYYLSAQTVAVQLRAAGSTIPLETVSLALPALSGRPSLRVDEARLTHSTRSIHYSFAQPARRRSVIGFVQPGRVQQLSREIRRSLERKQNRSRVVDPYSPPIEQGEYARFRYIALDASPSDVSLIEAWAGLPLLLCETERGDWRMGSFDVISIDRSGLRSDVEFIFTQMLV